MQKRNRINKSDEDSACNSDYNSDEKKEITSKKKKQKTNDWEEPTDNIAEGSEVAANGNNDTVDDRMEEDHDNIPEVEDRARKLSSDSNYFGDESDKDDEENVVVSSSSSVDSKSEVYFSTVGNLRVWRDFKNTSQEKADDEDEDTEKLEKIIISDDSSLSSEIKDDSDDNDESTSSKYIASKLLNLNLYSTF